MGENIGVGGAEESNMLSKDTVMAPVSLAVSAEGTGKASHVDVTSRDFSTARRYLPRYL